MGHDPPGLQPAVPTEGRQPGEILTDMLAHAQDCHRKCVVAAMAQRMDPVDKCALTWGEVHLRWMQWASYRAPFRTEKMEEFHQAYWTESRLRKAHYI